MLGQGFEQAGEFERAEKVYEELVAKAPDNQLYFQSLITVLQNQKKYPKASQIIENRYRRFPLDVNLAGMLGKNYYLSGEDAKAFSVWDDFLVKNKNYQYYRIVAVYASEVRAFDKSLKYLYAAKELTTDKRGLSYEIANLQCMMMNYASAGKEFAEILLSDPSQLASVEGRMFQYLTRTDALNGFIQALTPYEERHDNIDLLLARLLFENKQSLKAFAIYKRLDTKTNNNGNTLYNFGQQLIQAGNFTVASEVFAYLLNQYPNGQLTPLVKLSYAKSLEMVTRAEISRDSLSWKPLAVNSPVSVEPYKKVLQLYQEIVRIFRNSEPAIEAQLAIGNIYFQAGVYDSARAYYSHVSVMYAMSRFCVPAYFRLAEIALRLSDKAMALEWLNKILDNTQVKPEELNAARYKKALLLTTINRLDEARELLQKTSELTGDDNANDALELSMLLNTAMNDSVLVIDYAAALVQVETGEFASAMDLLVKVSGNKQQFYLKSLAELLRAELYIALSRYGELITLVNEINKQKSNIFEDKVNFFLGLTYNYGLHDKGQAQQVYETFLAEYPSSQYVDKVREELKRIKN